MIIPPSNFIITPFVHIVKPRDFLLVPINLKKERGREEITTDFTDYAD